MAKNLRALTDDELEYFNESYKFELLELVDGRKLVSVVCNGYNRTNIHSADEDFDISTKIRKVTIKKEAIDLWINSFRDKGYSLIDVQNAMNTLIVTYRANDESAISKQLNRGSAKIEVE